MRGFLVGLTVGLGVTVLGAQDYSKGFNRVSGDLVLTGPSATVGSVVTARTSDGLHAVRMFSDNVAGYFGTETNDPMIFQVNSTEFMRGVVGGLTFQGGGTLTFSSAIPTVSSGFGTSPTIAGRAVSFEVNVGTGGAASSGVIAMNATANQSWNCSVTNITSNAANRAGQWTVQTTGGQTTVTVQNQTISTGAALAWTASDILRLNCAAH